jgi:hypothetical protein
MRLAIVFCTDDTNTRNAAANSAVARSRSVTSSTFLRQGALETQGRAASVMGSSKPSAAAQSGRAFEGNVKTMEVTDDCLSVSEGEFKFPTALGSTEVEIRVTCCGVSGLDFQLGRNAWQLTPYPFVAGEFMCGWVSGGAC